MYILKKHVMWYVYDRLDRLLQKSLNILYTEL